MSSSPIRTAPIRTVIVEDETPALHKLALLLGREPDVEIVAQCRDVAMAERAIAVERPDLVMADIRVPGGDVLAVLGGLEPKPGPAVVFVTAHESYAIQAFDLEAVDYLLKPLDPRRLAEAVERVRRHLARDEGRAARYRRRLLLRTKGRMVLLPAAEIDWIDAAGSFVRIHAAGDTLTVRATLEAFEAELDPSLFLRLHRSTIVALARVREVLHTDYGDLAVVLENGQKLTVGRTYRRTTREALERAR